MIKGKAGDSPATLQRRIAAKVVPEAQTNLRQQHTATAAAAVDTIHQRIAFRGSLVEHQCCHGILELDFSGLTLLKTAAKLLHFPDIRKHARMLYNTKVR
jgi:hypothetical protein